MEIIRKPNRTLAVSTTCMVLKRKYRSLQMGFAIFAGAHYPDAKSDLALFREHLQRHRFFKKINTMMLN